MPKRACDGCSIRKIKCEGTVPCRACLKANLSCTFLKALRKGGPRKPHQKTLQQIQKTQHEYQQAQDEPVFESTFPYSILSTYLEIYHHRLYPVWPVVNYKTLLSDLQHNPQDVEKYALAAALAGATMAQLQLLPSTTDGIEVSADTFAKEALKLRRRFGLNERPNVNSILMSMFFHVYYENQGNLVSSTLYLREAVTFVQLLNLDKEHTYKGEEDEVKRRLFWLLFVTERGHMMVHQVPCILNRSISLPTVNNEPLLAGFKSLTKLFASFDKSVIESYISGTLSCSKEQLAAMQEQLDAVHPDDVNVNEVQKTDVLVTKHWMRTIVWQVSMSHKFLSSNSPGESMNLAFPSKIASDLLGFLEGVSHASIESHGPGMEFKLFEVTNSLADVILCIPTLSQTTSSWRVGPRDHLRGLFTFLVGIRGGNQQMLNIIKSKASNLLLNEPTCDQVLLPEQQEQGYTEMDAGITEVEEDVEMFAVPSVGTTSDADTTSPRLSEQTISPISSPTAMALGMPWTGSSADKMAVDVRGWMAECE